MENTKKQLKKLILDSLHNCKIDLMLNDEGKIIYIIFIVDKIRIEVKSYKILSVMKIEHYSGTLYHKQDLIIFPFTKLSRLINKRKKETLVNIIKRDLDVIIENFPKQPNSVEFVKNV